MLEIGKIRWSKSPARSPKLFVLKAHGIGLPLCTDYRVLNKVTIARHYQLPIISELQPSVQRARILAKMDLKNSYHLIQVRRVMNRKRLSVIATG
jgi:hypothetical protein